MYSKASERGSDGSSPLDVAACLQAVRAGNEEAARALVEQFYPLVIKIVRAHLPRRASEEDLAQDIFLKMFTRLDQYSGPTPFAHWLSRVAVTTCLDALRAQQRRPELRWADLSDAEADVASHALDQSHAADRTSLPMSERGEAAHELVEELLAHLSPEDQCVLRLLDLEERSVAEVGQLTGWNHALIKVRAFRARRKLRQHLARLETSRPIHHQ